MSESQRTPGDWKVVNEGSAVFAGEQLVASVFGDAEFMTGPVALANARLIAAAPEMLAELEDVGGLLEALLIMFGNELSAPVREDIGKRIAAGEALILKAEGGAE